MQDTTLNHDDWNTPLPLLEGVTLLPWPLDVFPEPFEKFAKELARSTETPVELTSMLTLAVVAAASQKHYKVLIKEDYNEPLNIWPLVILPPASRKSRVFAEVTQPLRDWEVSKKQSIEPLIQSIISKRKTMEIRLKELRLQAAKAVESKYELIQNQIEKIEREMPEVPSYPQIWTSDITPEHLGTIMSVNDEAMVVMSDEGGIFDILSGLYSDGKANIDLFLQSHSASPVRVDRGSRPPVFMQRPVLTMCLTVQPTVIKNACSNKTFRGRGLLGRFLYVIPKSNIGLRTFEEPPIGLNVVKSFQEAIKNILEIPDRNNNDKRSQYSILIKGSAGYSKWLEYAKTVEILMGDEIDHLSHITDWAGKLPGAVARIAALLHIMRHAYQKPWEHSISIDDMKAAVKIGHCLTNHALIVFDLLQQEGAMNVAKAIYQWITDEKHVSFTRRECSRKFRRVKKDELKSALSILEEHEIVHEKEFSLKTVGRKSNIFEVNPYLVRK